MKRFEIEVATFQAMVEEDLKAAEGFEKHIRNAINEMAANIGDFDCNSYAEAIKYNQHWLRVYAERAASKLQMVGLHNPDRDPVELAFLRDRLNELTSF